MNFKVDEITQEIVLTNRKDLKITGVKKLESLNPSEFNIETSLGRMVIRGVDLEMQQLDIENGILLITGQVYLMEYMNKPLKEKQKGFISKLFK